MLNIDFIDSRSHVKEHNSKNDENVNKKRKLRKHIASKKYKKKYETKNFDSEYKAKINVEPPK
jgi:hypothetical protein